MWLLKALGFSLANPGVSIQNPEKKLKHSISKVFPFPAPVFRVPDTP
jgi:hypothetical protein